MDKTLRSAIQSNPTVPFRHHFQVTIFLQSNQERERFEIEREIPQGKPARRYGGTCCVVKKEISN
jgi:hypothetical protein